MSKIRGYGCSSVVNAIVLQFDLAGHGLKTKILRAKGGMWVVEATLGERARVRNTVTPAPVPDITYPLRVSEARSEEVCYETQGLPRATVG